MARYPEVGSTLGRYRLLEELGRGGMAVVFRAEDPRLAREVAIKVLHEHLWDRPEYAMRFVREARAVARLRHPNILEVYDYGGADGDDEERGEDRPKGYIVAELVRGPTLREFVERRGALLPEVAAMIGLKLAEALDCAHGEGIVHRDLKPENVIIAERGRVVLTDFGIARILEGESVTQTGALLGSPGYMSPEQARGDRVDARSDLFSLGTLIYQLCTGRLPFVAKDPIATVLLILEGKHEPAIAVNSRVGRPIDRLIAKLMQPAPSDRFESARQVAAAIRELLDEIGLADVDAQLQRYFADPGDYNRDLVQRIVTRSLQLAREATSTRQVPRALALCDRVLAFDETNAEALRLVKEVSARRATRLAVGTTAALLLLVGGGLLGWRWLAGPAVGPPRDATAVVAAAGEPGGDAPADAELDARSANSARADSATQASGDGAPAANGARPLTRAPRRRRPPRTKPDGGRPATGALDAALVRRADAVTAGPVPTDAPGRLRLPGRGSAQPATAAARRTADSAPPDPGPARLLVTIGPWCDLLVDGHAVGRSPMVRPIEIAPGRHLIVCRQGRTGAMVRREIVARAGQLSRVEGPLRQQVLVRLQLTKGDAIRIDGRRYTGQVRLSPRPYRIDLLSGERTLGGRWVTIPPRGCTLVDQPTLRCQ